MIPHRQIDEVLARTDLIGLIGNRVTLKPAGSGRMRGCCPFHNEKTPSFTVYLDQQNYHCFGCGVHGNAIHWVMHQHGLNYPEAVRSLARDCGITINETADKQRDTQQQVNPALTLLAEIAQWYQENLFHHRQAPTARAYLHERGINAAMQQAFHLGYAPPGWDNTVKRLGNDPQKTALARQLGLIKQKDPTDSSNTAKPGYDMLRDRLVFPIANRKGETVGFGGRSLHPDQVPKYLNSSDSDVFHKGSLLYGEYQARQAGRVQKWLVVEGYMDVIAMHQHGFTNTVACLGTAITEQQIATLLRYTKQACFIFDGDAAGKKAAIRAMQLCKTLLHPGIHCDFLLLPENTDPDSLLQKKGASELQHMLADALHWSDFFLQWVYAQADRHSIEGKTSIMDLAEKELRSLPDSNFRTLLLRQIRETLGLGYSRKRNTKKSAAPIHWHNLSSEARQQACLIKLLAAVVHTPESWANLRHQLLPQLQNFCPPLPAQVIACLEYINDNENLAPQLAAKLDHHQRELLNQHLDAMEPDNPVTESGIRNLTRSTLRECWESANLEQRQSLATSISTLTE